MITFTINGVVVGAVGVVLVEVLLLFGYAIYMTTKHK